LTKIEQKLWKEIVPEDFATHKPPSHISETIAKSTKFFNYVTRMIEMSILESPTALGRSMAIIFWIKVGGHLKALHNYQTLNALIASFTTPPIYRIEYTWSLVPKAMITSLEALQDCVGKGNNFKVYRDLVSNLDSSIALIPYIGLFIHDMTYISAISSTNGNSAQLKQELIEKIHDYQLHHPYLISQYEAQRKGKKALIRESVSPEIYSYFQGAPEPHIFIFTNHWLLSRKLISEREIDLLSNSREDKSVRIKARKSLIFPIDTGISLATLSVFGSIFSQNSLN
jgi:hypothetical protein